MDLTKLIESEANKQVKALAAMETRLDKRSVALQKELYALIRDRFLDSLARDENGKLLYNASNLNRVNNMAATWEYFRESSFRPEVLEFGKDLISIVDVEAGYFMAIGKEFNIPMEFDQVRDLISKQIGITLERNPSIIPDSYLDRLLKASTVQDKVTNIVLENVSAKASFMKLKSDLSDVILGSEDVNGAMTKYLRTYAYDTFSVVQRTVDLNMADQYGMNCFVYEGNLIKDSREFCEQHLGEIICRDQFADFEAQDWAGKNPDVPFEVSLGGYNCRHTPMWIPDEAKPYLEKEGGVVPEEGGGYIPLSNENYKDEFKERASKFIEGEITLSKGATKIHMDNALQGLEHMNNKYGLKLSEFHIVDGGVGNRAGFYVSREGVVKGVLNGKYLKENSIYLNTKYFKNPQLITDYKFNDLSYAKNRINGSIAYSSKNPVTSSMIHEASHHLDKYNGRLSDMYYYELAKAYNTNPGQSLKYVFEDLRKDEKYLSSYMMGVKNFDRKEFFAEVLTTYELGGYLPKTMIEALETVLKSIL